MMSGAFMTWVTAAGAQSFSQASARDSVPNPKWKGKALFPIPERRMAEIDCLNATHHKMPDGMVMLNSDMNPNPCEAYEEKYKRHHPEDHGGSGHHDKDGHGGS